MSTLQDARNRVRNDLGTVLEQKCSHAFALCHGRTGAVAPPEAWPRRRGATILELQAKAMEAPLARVSAATTNRARQALADVLREAGERHPELAATSTLRRRLLERTRDGFLEDTRPLVEALERASRTRPTPPDDDDAQTTHPRFVDICWLNACIRTAANARAAAAVADDRRVQRIDVPRKLRREIGATAGLVGAPAYRTAHGVSGNGVIVAVIDTEIHAGHPALTGRVFRKRNYVDEPWADETGGHPQAPHGTAVAGIIAASAALSGMAPALTFYNYKVLPNNEALPVGDDFDGAVAIQHALQDGAHIANCSWGADPSQTDHPVLDGQSREARACNTAWALGLVIVNSAGNEGPGASTLTTPADADGVIVVGATDRAGTSVPSYASRGPTAHGLQRPHLVAPGGANPDFITSCTIFGGFFAGFVGTSFAAAHVSGLAALLLERQPDLTPDEVRTQLLGMCTPLPGVDPAAQGHGLIRIV